MLNLSYGYIRATVSSQLDIQVWVQERWLVISIPVEAVVLSRAEVFYFIPPNMIATSHGVEKAWLPCKRVKPTYFLYLSSNSDKTAISMFLFFTVNLSDSTPFFLNFSNNLYSFPVLGPNNWICHIPRNELKLKAKKFQVTNISDNYVNHKSHLSHDSFIPILPGLLKSWRPI